MQLLLRVMAAKRRAPCQKLIRNKRKKGKGTHAKTLAVGERSGESAGGILLPPKCAQIAAAFFSQWPVGYGCIGTCCYAVAAASLIAFLRDTQHPLLFFQHAQNPKKHSTFIAGTPRLQTLRPPWLNMPLGLKNAGPWFWMR